MLVPINVCFNYSLLTPKGSFISLTPHTIEIWGDWCNNMATYILITAVQNTIL